MVDLIDETFLVATPAAVARYIRDPAQTARWWPDLELTVFQDREDAGVRWTVTGGLVGTAEIWLEPVADGTVMHVFLRADPTRRGHPTEAVTGAPAAMGRRGQKETRRRAQEIKRWAWALKDTLEAGRAAGEPRPVQAQNTQSTQTAISPAPPAPAATVRQRPRPHP